MHALQRMQQPGRPVRRGLGEFRQQLFIQSRGQQFDADTITGGILQGDAVRHGPAVQEQLLLGIELVRTGLEQAFGQLQEGRAQPG